MNEAAQTSEWDLETKKQKHKKKKKKEKPPLSCFLDLRLLFLIRLDHRQYA